MRIVETAHGRSSEEKREDSMLTTPQIVDRDAQPYAAVRRSIPMSELGGIVGPSFDLVLGFVRQSTDDEPGPPFIRYDLIDMEGVMELEFGIPLSSPVEASGEIVVGELPAGRYATVTHTGSYDELYDVTAILVGWAKERGIEWDSTPEGSGERFVSRIESYLNAPSDVPEDELVTELYVKLRPASTDA